MLFKNMFHFKLNKLIENCKQYRSPLPVGTFVVISTKFIGLSTKVSDIHGLVTVIYPSVKCVALTLSELSQNPDFTFSVSIATIFGLFTKQVTCIISIFRSIQLSSFKFVTWILYKL